MHLIVGQYSVCDLLGWRQKYSSGICQYDWSKGFWYIIWLIQIGMMNELCIVINFVIYIKYLLFHITLWFGNVILYKLWLLMYHIRFYYCICDIQMCIYLSFTSKGPIKTNIIVIIITTCILRWKPLIPTLWWMWLLLLDLNLNQSHQVLNAV